MDGLAAKSRRSRNGERARFGLVRGHGRHGSRLGWPLSVSHRYLRRISPISGRGYADGTLLAHALHSLRLVALGFAVARHGRAARPADGLEPAGRGVDQSGLPAHPADPAAGLDSAGDPVARPRRRREDHGDLVRGLRARRDQQLLRRPRRSSPISSRPRACSARRAGASSRRF